jgi:hypothetical protein
MVFLSNVQKWEQERGKLESVDLRYGREVILNPDRHAAPPPPSPQATKGDAAPRPHGPGKKTKNGRLAEKKPK